MSHALITKFCPNIIIYEVFCGSLNVTLLFRCPNDHSKKADIDKSLFLETNPERKYCASPVCDYVYREESAAKFYTGHSKEERKIMWDLLGDVKYKLQVWGKPQGFLNTQIRDLSIECQFIVTLLILKQNVSYTGNSLSKALKLN